MIIQENEKAVNQEKHIAECTLILQRTVFAWHKNILFYFTAFIHVCLLQVICMFIEERVHNICYYCDVRKEWHGQVPKKQKQRTCCTASKNNRIARINTPEWSTTSVSQTKLVFAAFRWCNATLFWWNVRTAETSGVHTEPAQCTQSWSELNDVGFFLMLPKTYIYLKKYQKEVYMWSRLCRWESGQRICWTPKVVNKKPKNEKHNTLTS